MFFLGMEFSAQACPSFSSWESYSLAGADRPDSELDGHLLACPECRDAYFGLIQKPYTPRIPQCQIVGEIGRGRFGVVYKAWWLKDQPEIVALKLLHSFGEMEKHRFDREISVLSHLESPGIVRCRASGGNGDSRYFIMDYVAGTHLDEYLRKSELDLKDRLAVLRRVCLAVADAHTAGVVHRDLKPRNILVEGNGQPHILDFGICSVSGVDWTSWADGTITLPGDIIGTLKYMSPEQAWGGGVAEQVGQATDMWALGIMLYEIATDGDYPYALKSTREKPAPEALLERIRKEVPKMPNLCHIKHGRDLEILIERCLTWEPQRRLSSAQVLADDLARFIADQPVHTQPHGRWYRTRRVIVGAATRSRAAFYAVFVAAAIAGISSIALLSGAGWRVVGNPFPTSVATLTAGESEPLGPKVRIIGIGDESPEQIQAFAAAHGLSTVTASAVSWRIVHGMLLTRLARARPAAVIWDYYFRTPQPDDRTFAAGVRMLESAGVPVVLAARTFDASGHPDVSPTILAELGDLGRFGAILARDMVRRTGEFVAVVRRLDDSVLPSVTLVALAAMARPGTRLETTWYGDQKSIDLLYEVSPGSYLRQRDRMQLTRAVPASSNDPAVREGDLLGCIDFSLAPIDFWQSRTIAYENVLTMTDAELHAATNGQVLIFGDIRTPSVNFVADRHPVAYPTGVEPSVPGCYLLADAMTGMMNQRFLRLAYPLTLPTTIAMLSLAFAGCVLAIPATRGTWCERAPLRRYVYMFTLVMMLLGGTMLWRSESTLLVHAGMGLIAFFAAFAGSLWVELTRNHHQLLDKRSRTLRPFGAGTSNTVELDAVNAAA